MIEWTSLAPREFEFPLSGRLKPTFLPPMWMVIPAAQRSRKRARFGWWGGGGFGLEGREGLEDREGLG